MIEWQKNTNMFSMEINSISMKTILKIHQHKKRPPVIKRWSNVAIENIFKASIYEGLFIATFDYYDKLNQVTSACFMGVSHVVKGLGHKVDWTLKCCMFFELEAKSHLETGIDTISTHINLTAFIYTFFISAWNFICTYLIPILKSLGN